MGAIKPGERTRIIFITTSEYNVFTNIICRRRGADLKNYRSFDSIM